MSNLALIQPQRVDFDTCQTCDWLDGLPMIGTPSLAGTSAAAGNVGNGGILVTSVARGAAYGGHTVTVTEVSGGFVRLSAAAPDGMPTGSGLLGVPFYAGGITLRIDPGTTALTVGDGFGIGIVPAPVDITGLQFDLDARAAPGSATQVLTASSAGEAPTIAVGGAAGTVAMNVLRLTMAQLPIKSTGYPYAITAMDPATGLRVPAFYGLINHVAIPALIGAS